MILPIKQNKSKRSPSIERPSDEHLIETATKIVEKVEITEDVSDVSDTGDDVIEIQHDIEDIDGSPSNCDTDASEVPPLTEARSEVQNEPVEKENPLVVDDNSSTCSTDSVPSVGINGQYKGNTLQGRKSPASPIRYLEIDVSPFINTRLAYFLNYNLFAYAEENINMAMLHKIKRFRHEKQMVHHLILPLTKIVRRIPLIFLVKLHMNLDLLFP